MNGRESIPTALASTSNTNEDDSHERTSETNERTSETRMEQTNKKSLPTNKTFHIFLPNIITCSYSPTIIIYHDFCKIRSETTNVHSSGDRALCACYCVWCGWQRRKKINLFIYFYHVFFYIFLFCIHFSSSQQLNLDIFHENPVFLFSFLSRQHSCGANI